MRRWRALRRLIHSLLLSAIPSIRILRLLQLHIIAIRSIVILLSIVSLIRRRRVSWRRVVRVVVVGLRILIVGLCVLVVLHWTVTSKCPACASIWLVAHLTSSAGCYAAVIEVSGCRYLGGKEGLPEYEEE